MVETAASLNRCETSSESAAIGACISPGLVLPRVPAGCYTQAINAQAQEDVDGETQSSPRL